MIFGKQSFRHLLVAVATGWMLLGLLPEGLRLCSQADGNFEIGLGCPCETCNAGVSASPCCPANVSCTDLAQPGIASTATCCTCSELAVLPAAPSLSATDLNRIDSLLTVVLLLDCQAPPLVDHLTARPYQAHAPPQDWQPGTIRLLI